jgi:D-sedoheptulose 7-phosphate isomerase
MALTGKGGGALKSLADLALVVPSEVTAHIQECHIVMGHLLCDGIEQGLALV